MLSVKVDRNSILSIRDSVDRGPMLCVIQTLTSLDLCLAIHNDMDKGLLNFVKPTLGLVLVQP